MARRCTCTVVWATTVPNNKAIPLEPIAVAPSTKGALFLVDGKWAYSLKELSERISKREQTSIERAQEKVRTWYPAHLAHFDKCPDLARFREPAR